MDNENTIEQMAARMREVGFPDHVIHDLVGVQVVDDDREGTELIDSEDVDEDTILAV